MMVDSLHCSKCICCGRSCDGTWVASLRALFFPIPILSCLADVS